jgi:CO dehydrogenase maturation factor
MPDGTRAGSWTPEGRGVKVAVSGKGGVGKTTVAGTLARILARQGVVVLAIDADPNANLGVTLGVPREHAEAVIPVSENAALIEEKTGVSPEASGGVFRLSFRVDDIIDRFGVPTPDGVILLVMGVVRSAGQGCMCPANALIRALLRHLLVRREEVVILDMEAGTEHLGRRTAEHVNVMLIVSDANRKSLETAKHIYALARDMGVQQVYLVGNKVLDSFDEAAITAYCRNNGLPLLALIPYDEEIRKHDVKGDALSLATASSGLHAIQALSERLLATVG